MSDPLLGVRTRGAFQSVAWVKKNVLSPLAHSIIIDTEGKLWFQRAVFISSRPSCTKPNKYKHARAHTHILHTKLSRLHHMDFAWKGWMRLSAICNACCAFCCMICKQCILKHNALYRVIQQLYFIALFLLELYSCFSLHLCTQCSLLSFRIQAVTSYASCI